MNIKLFDYGYKKTPKRAHHNDAGADVFATKDFTIRAGETKLIGTGLGLDLPDGNMGLFMSKSSLVQKGIVIEFTPIDSGYTGEIFAVMRNHGTEDYIFNEGDKMGQIVIVPVLLCNFVKEHEKERGAGGFGSTGRF